MISVRDFTLDRVLEYKEIEVEVTSGDLNVNWSGSEDITGSLNEKAFYGFKDKHKDKEAILFCTGPSLAHYEKLENEDEMIRVGVNGTILNNEIAFAPHPKLSDNRSHLLEQSETSRCQKCGYEEGDSVLQYCPLIEHTLDYYFFGDDRNQNSYLVAKPGTDEREEDIKLMGDRFDAGGGQSFGIGVRSYKPRIQKFAHTLRIDWVHPNHVSVGDAKNVYGALPYAETIDLPYAKDIRKECLFGHGVGLRAIQFILFTGIRRLYLVGADCSAFSSGPNLDTDMDTYHFYDGNKIGNVENPGNAVDSEIEMQDVHRGISLKEDWINLKKFKDKEYPDVEIVSVNPVFMRGVFDRDIVQEKWNEKQNKDSGNLESGDIIGDEGEVKTY
jgi:hypothetical protein